MGFWDCLIGKSEIIPLKEYKQISIWHIVVIIDDHYATRFDVGTFNTKKEAQEHLTNTFKHIERNPCEEFLKFEDTIVKKNLIKGIYLREERKNVEKVIENADKQIGS
jgi:hypothetical protein